MRILFVADRWPFPPRDGVSLPVARLARGLGSTHQVDLAVLGWDQDEDREPGVGDEGEGEPPPEIGRVFRLGGGQGRGAGALVDELLLRRPSFEWRGFDPAGVDDVLARAPWDVAWLSPVGCLGLLREARRRGQELARHTALGLNDAVTTLYAATAREGTRSGDDSALERVAKWVRLPWVWHHERRALRGVDVVHVQTALEARRVRRILGREREEPGGPWILTAQNGRKTELERVEPCAGAADAPPRVLLMAHLGPDPAPGAWWFLNEVWPGIRRRTPDAELDLVGRVPESALEDLPEGVSPRGLVEDLPGAYARARVAVVPMFRNTGLVNRALDALTAGVPLVTTREVLMTVEGAREGQHALAAGEPEAFADAVAGLLEDPERARALGRAGRELALEQPTWEDTIARVELALEQVAEGVSA